MARPHRAPSDTRRAFPLFSAILRVAFARDYKDNFRGRHERRAA